MDENDVDSVPRAVLQVPVLTYSKARHPVV